MLYLLDFCIPVILNKSYSKCTVNQHRSFVKFSLYLRQRVIEKDIEYEIQYGLIQNNTLEDMYDDNLNPETKVFISLYDDRIVHLSNNFIIVRFDDKNGKYISSKKIMSFTERICNIDVSIYYKCNLNETAFNCSLRNEDKRNYYYIFLLYKTF